MIKFPEKGQEVPQILEQLQALKEKDIPWQSGKTLAYTYEPDGPTYELIKKAYSMFLTENGLDPTAFPSLLFLEKEVIQMAIDLLNGNDEVVGTFTSGGTESIMLSVKAARDYCRAHHPQIEKPELVLPRTAHAAFYKACHYLDIKPIIVEADPETYRADPAKMEQAISSNTIMLVASAPSYAQGVIDPIAEIGQIAKKNNLLFHVDACVGGMYLPFAKNLGFEIPDFDFQVEGVTSMSMDFHKYGYTAKGASCVLLKNKELKQFQIYSCAEWSGYALVNPTIVSSKGGGSLAACWATIKYLGSKGYQDMLDKTQQASIQIQEWIKTKDELTLQGNPAMNMIAFGTTPDLSWNVMQLAGKMKIKGWYLQVQLETITAPENIHLSVNRSNVPFIEEFLKDMEDSIKELNQEKQIKFQDTELFQYALGMMKEGKIEELQNSLGIKSGEIGDDLVLINSLINKLNVKERERLMTTFMNALYSNV